MASQAFMALFATAALAALIAPALYFTVIGVRNDEHSPPALRG